MAIILKFRWLMGLAQAEFCDFIVYTFKGMVIIRTAFDKSYFDEVITRLSSFYKQYLLPKLAENSDKVGKNTTNK